MNIAFDRVQKHQQIKRHIFEVKMIRLKILILAVVHVVILAHESSSSGKTVLRFVITPRCLSVFLVFYLRRHDIGQHKYEDITRLQETSQNIWKE